MDARRDALGSLEGRSVNLADRLVTPGLRTIELRFGIALGLIDARQAIRIENRRAMLGYRQDALQQWISRALPDEAYEVSDHLRVEDDAVLTDDRARRLWFVMSLGLLLDVWRRGGGDCRLDLVEFCAAWDGGGAKGWEALKPRGIDTVVFGEGARRRLLERVSAFVADRQAASS